MREGSELTINDAITGKSRRTPVARYLKRKDNAEQAPQTTQSNRHKIFERYGDNKAIIRGRLSIVVLLLNILVGYALMFFVIDNLLKA